MIRTRLVLAFTMLLLVAASAAAESGQFFFSSRRRHTRSKRDWSSDVCSSDLSSESAGNRRKSFPAGGRAVRETLTLTELFALFDRSRDAMRGIGVADSIEYLNLVRSEERRVGKECRRRWSPCHEKVRVGLDV